MTSRIHHIATKIVLGLTALLIAYGCKVGPNYQSSAPDPMADYRFDSLNLVSEDTFLNLKWWELFQDPALDSLISLGLAQNQDVIIAITRIEQSRAAVGITKADYWPQFNYQAGYSYGNVLVGIPTEGGSSTDLISGFATMSWELDFWGKLRRSNEAARAELAASEYGLRTVQIGLISQITTTYFQLLDFQWRLEISQKTLDLRNASLAIIQARYDEGIIPEIDVNQAQIQQAIAATAVPFYRRRVAQTENALSILLGRNPGPITVGSSLYDQPTPPDIPLGLPSDLLVRRPDIVRAEQQLVAQNAQVGVAVAGRFPTISLTGLLGVASTDLSSLTAAGPAWSIGGTLLGPLFNFGKNKRRVEIERLETEAVLQQYERTVITAFQEVEDALVEISTLKEEIVARQNRVTAAVNAQTLSQERYDKGVTSYLELLESQRQAFEAELGLSESIQLLFNGYVSLYKALGGGWISQQEMNNALNPPPPDN